MGEMSHFGATITIRRDQDSSVHYFFVRLHPQADTKSRAVVQTAIRRCCRQLFLRANDGLFWVVALSFGDAEAIRKLPGVALVGGVSVDPKRLMETLGHTGSHST